MTDYTKTTNFTAKDSLAVGDPAKLILGSLFDTEYDAIAVAIATKFDVLDVASSAEAQAGASNSKVITPLQLENWAAQNAGIVQDLSNLADPGADRLLFWDESADAAALLTVSTGLTISGTNITTNDSQIVHDSLSGFVANEHIDHSTVSITAGTGLTGGGTIAATRTLNLDISGLTALGVEPDGTDGFLVDDAGTMKRIAWSVIDALFATAAQGTLASNALQKDGTVALTANWDAGSFDITAEQFHSDIATGTAPFTVASTTVVTNLNADTVDGLHASSFLQNVVEDTTPQLGGSLDVNGQKIVSVSNGNIDIEPHGTGNVLLGNFMFNADQTVGAGEDNYVLTYDNATGTIGLEVAPGSGGAAVATDAIWDAAGDLVYGTGNNAASRLAIGTAGQILKVNAGATAPEWATDVAGIDSTAIHDNVSGEIAAVTAKATPVNADLVLIEDSAASNAKKKVELDDLVAGGVVSGTFTPTLLDDSLSASESQTYSTQAGFYHKVGKLVFFRIALIVTSLGTLTTTQRARIGGLPFTSENVANSGTAVYVGSAAALDLAATAALTGIIAANVDYIALSKWSATAGTANLTIAEVSADATLQLAGWYVAA